MMDEMKPPSYESVAAGYDPSAPSINKAFEPDEGYEEPPSAPVMETPQRPTLVTDMDRLNEPEIKEACMNYVAENCCYGSKAIREMILTEITNGCTYHYILETFGEKRVTAFRSTPYTGQWIDGPENGVPPRPWDVVVREPQSFADSQMKLEVPHTASVKQCSTCVGNCRVRCESCHGRGGETCWSCTFGNDNGRRCTSCSGTGRRVCWSCNGTGQVRCRTCKGHGKLKHYQLLVVTWKNHMDDFISHTGNLPKELIRDVAGREIFREEYVTVNPINHAPDSAVNAASSRLVAKHQTAFPTELIRKQRHVLRAVPLTTVKYIWRTKNGEFFIYGFQKKVYFEDYPQPCCCCTCL
ncbi:protein SSUH2 homolog [Stegodyphus dumicola]|uniref:protein SSUH2 homolog n=1 Tax=Stegodyphus dumicola TaxID=202533 RepID=UPI0015AA7147|nr:protein SSUH2 homolog [Stegodyphus dumicola]XP_035221743.1 protein SSUH2 homolog [Stegodyphus dumicola]